MKAGTTDHATSVRHLACQFFTLRRRSNHAQLVAQPLDRGSRHEDRAFQRVGGAVCRGSHGCQQTGIRRHGLASSVREQETAGAVGILRVTGLPAGLAEKRRLLIACDARDGNSGAKQCRIGASYKP